MGRVQVSQGTLSREDGPELGVESRDSRGGFLGLLRHALFDVVHCYERMYRTVPDKVSEGVGFGTRCVQVGSVRRCMGAYGVRYICR